MIEKQEKENTAIALMGKDISYIQRDIATINTSIKELTGVYVTRQEFLDFIKGDFSTMKKVVYGAVGVILLGFIGAIVGLVTRQ